MSKRVTQYVDELRRTLRSQGIFDAQVVDELRDHLIDAIEEGRLRGLTVDAAESEALARCGPPELVSAHVAAGVPRLRRGALLALCTATILASAFLSLSLLIFQPPRANYPVWIVEAMLFAIQGAITIIVLLRGGAPSTSIRALLTAGGIAVAYVGSSALYATATHHFEGYVLLLGILLTFQGILTIVYFRRRSLQIPTTTVL